MAQLLTYLVLFLGPPFIGGILGSLICCVGGKGSRCVLGGIVGAASAPNILWTLYRDVSVGEILFAAAMGIPSGLAVWGIHSLIWRKRDEIARARADRRLTRLSGIPAILGGVVAVMRRLLPLPVPVIGMLLHLTPLFCLLGLCGLYARQKRGFGELGRFGFYMAAWALCMAAYGLQHESWAFAWTLYPLGLIIFGFVTLKAKILPWWSRPLPLLMGLMIAGPLTVGSLWWITQWGTLISQFIGFCWIVLGFVLLSRKGEQTEGDTTASETLSETYPDEPIEPQDRESDQQPAC